MSPSPFSSRQCPFHSRRCGVALTLVAIATLGACGKTDKGTQSAAVAVVQQATPEVKAIYDRSCRNCHAVPASGAPQTGDAQAWAPRVAQGADVLLEHTFTGYKSMPPLGACMDCKEEQYRALIEYMSGTTLRK